MKVEIGWKLNDEWWLVEASSGSELYEGEVFLIGEPVVYVSHESEEDVHPASLIDASLKRDVEGVLLSEHEARWRDFFEARY